MKHELTAKRLKQALDDNRMKAIELSQKSGIAKSSISQYINGSHKPSNISSGAMAKVLKVSPLWLMGFDVPMKEEDTIPDATYTEDYLDIIEVYSQLDERQKDKLKAFAQFLLKEE